MKIMESNDELKRKIKELELELETYKAGNRLLKATLDKTRRKKNECKDRQISIEL